MQAKEILNLVGGEANIISVSHCMTRLRFVLVDEVKADVNGIEKLSIVKGTFTQAGQFQVIVGNDVSQTYTELIADTKFVNGEKTDTKPKESKPLNPMQKATTYLSEIFAPIIPAIIVGGLILGFKDLLNFPINGTSLVEQTQFWAGFASILGLIAQAVFIYLPVHICWSSYRRVGGTEVLGIVLGITLISSQLLSSYDLSTVSPIPSLDFGFFTIDMIGYQAQVIPAILVGIFGGMLEVKLTKVIPSYIQMIVVPFTVLIVTVLMAQAILGPIGWWLGTQISSGVTWLFTTFGLIGGMIFGFCYAPLSLTGLHHTTNLIDMEIIARNGVTPLWPLIALSNIAQGSAVLAIAYLQKDPIKRESSVPASISAYLGVTEPALFGVNLKYVFPFVCGMIGSSLAGGYSILMGVTSTSIGVGGLPGILSISAGSYLHFLIAMVIAIIVPFVLTSVTYKRKVGKDGLLDYDRQ